MAANGAALSASSAAESAASGQAVACIGNAASGRGEIAVEKEGLVKIFPPAQIKTPSWQISLASLGIAAAQFARCGFDVSIQYGADKPAHDLVITKGSNLLKVVVKGSQDGLWDLTQSYIRRAAQISGKKADYYGAIGMWLDHHSSRTVCCLVQFQGVTMDELPRIYLATPSEVAQRLRETAEGRGDSVLYEGIQETSDADSSGEFEGVPAAWRFSLDRIQELMTGQARALTLVPLPEKAESPPHIWPSGVRFTAGEEPGIAKRA